MAYKRPKGRKFQIKDHMDGILESKSFYRKHVAEDSLSLYRAIADQIFGTQSQRYRDIVSRAAQLILEEGHVQNSHEKFDLISKLAEFMRFRVEIVSSAERDLKPFFYSPPNPEASEKKLLLCFTPPCQYEPIYTKSTIESAGICQSILYELLYHKVLNLPDAMDAADQMLFGSFEDGKKPDMLAEPSFQGTAMDALEVGLIPFPYKVAKCLDASSYRNIEYDVWTCEKQEDYVKRAKAHHQEDRPRFRPKLNIASLKEGTPCLLKFEQHGTQLGYIRGPCKDKRLIEVYVPTFDQMVFADRSAVLPLKDTPPDHRFLPRRPDEPPRFFDQDTYPFDCSEFFDDHSSSPDFSNPPPGYPEEPVEDHVEPQDHHHRPRPPPLDLSHNDTWEYEHYAGCYTCQAHQTTPHTCCNRPAIPTSPTVFDYAGASAGCAQNQQMILPLFPALRTPLSAQQSYVLVSPLPTPTTPTTFVFQFPSPLNFTPSTPLLQAQQPQQQSVFVFPPPPAPPSSSPYEMDDQFLE